MATINFKGKEIVRNYHLVVPYHELKPDVKKSFPPKADRDQKVGLNDNLIIHGDNLLALKALLPTYAGKVKCIYIDPPYNTGNEKWAYNDNVNSPMMKEWLGKVVDKDDLTRHDKWLCMMMPRLKLLRELLRDDGVIFVSIDDNEVAHLRMLSNEVFGEENFVTTFIWNTKNAPRGVPTKTLIIPNHEYVFCCGKISNPLKFKGVVRSEEDFSNPDNDPRGLWRSESLRATGKQDNYFSIIDPKTGNKLYGNWAFSEQTIKQMIKDKKIIFPKTKDGTPRQKKFLNDYTYETKAIVTNLGTFLTEASTKYFQSIFEGIRVFDNPKPLDLIKFLITQVTEKHDIILDSFAGSGTTAHAVLDLNKEDGGNRKFVLVEMEDYADKITAERVRRVIKGVKGAKNNNLKNGLGGTFSYFELGKPIDAERILKGKDLPSFVEMARYIFYTATGEEFNEKKINEKTGFIGESKEYKVYLLYKSDLEYLKSTALTLDWAQKLGKFTGKKRLIFAPTKYLDHEHLERLGIEFAQLPFDIYKKAE